VPRVSKTALSRHCVLDSTRKNYNYFENPRTSVSSHDAHFVTGYTRYEKAPQGFHAVEAVEADLGWRWLLFDPTELAPIDGSCASASAAMRPMWHLQHLSDRRGCAVRQRSASGACRRRSQASC
jgi:hypothetical protein